MDVWHKTNYFKKSPLVGRRITDAGACDARTNGYGSLQLFSGVLKIFHYLLCHLQKIFLCAVNSLELPNGEKIVAGFG